MDILKFRQFLLHITADSNSVCCSTQRKYWISVMEKYWSIITSMAFQIILVLYQYSIEILNYFSVSLSVFPKVIRVPKFEYFIVLKIFHFIQCLVINCFHGNCQISCQECQIVYIIEHNILKNRRAFFGYLLKTKI